MPRFLSTGLVVLVALTALPALAQAQSRERGWIGLTYGRVPPDLAAKGAPQGVYVQMVVAGSPADQAGFREGDIIISLNDAPLTEPKAFYQVQGILPVGSLFQFKVHRAGQILALELKSIKRDPDEAIASALKRGAEYLVKQRLPDGGWPHFRSGNPGSHAATTALILTALGELPPELRAPHDPLRRQIATQLLKAQDERGAIVPRVEDLSKFINYCSALTYRGLALLGEAQHDAAAQRILDYLLARQLDSRFEVDRYDPRFGAWDYYDDNGKNTTRADMSIVSHVLDALAVGPADKTAPARARALKFLERCQNYTEDQSDPRRAAMDGGFRFAYAESKAGFVDVAGKHALPASYGSATADGLRSLLAAGAAPDAARVRAALAWLEQHAKLDKNPGFEEGGPVNFEEGILFYYQAGLARALAQLQRLGVRPQAEGLADWADKLALWLADRQKPGGEWKNRLDLMNEDQPVLATALALRALAAAQEARTKGKAGQ